MNNEKGRENPLWDVLRSRPTAADCQRCQQQLDEYVTAQLNGRHVRAEFPWVARHLDACVDCAHAYALVYDVAHADQTGTLPTPAAIPDPDLSFLQQSLADRLRRALTQTGNRLTLQLDAALRTLLIPPPAAALVRSGASGRYHPAILTLPPDQLPDADPPFTLTAYADSQQPDRCLVEVTVHPPGQSWPDLGGRAVTLTTADGSQTAATDDWGVAAFPDVLQAALDTLVLSIEQ